MRLGHFDLNLFITLDALLDTVSVVRASERLNITASATSNALARLREQFSDPLLVQIGKRMELTALARRLREPVREILLLSQATLSASPQFDPSTEVRSFVFNASDFATTVLLTPLSKRLARLAPNISINVLGLGDDPHALLNRGEIDFVVYPNETVNKEHPKATLFSESYCCVVWKENSTVGDDLSMDQYISMNHVITGIGGKRVAQFEKWFIENYAKARKVSFVVDSFSAIPALLVGTEHIATMHVRLARIFAEVLPLRMLKTPFTAPDLELILQWNRHNESDAAHTWLREQLLDIAREA